MTDEKPLTLESLLRERIREARKAREEGRTVIYTEPAGAAAAAALFRPRWKSLEAAAQEAAQEAWDQKHGVHSLELPPDAEFISLEDY